MPLTVTGDPINLDESRDFVFETDTDQIDTGDGRNIVLADFDAFTTTYGTSRTEPLVLDGLISTISKIR